MHQHLPGLYQAQPLYPGGGHLQLQPLLGAHQLQAVHCLDQGISQALNQSQVLQQDSQVNSIPSLNSLLTGTIINKQYFPIDFAKLAYFPYISQLKQSNLNLSL